VTQTQVGTASDRTRTFWWSDPAVSAGRVGALSGLDFLRAIGSGDLPRPPVMHLLGVAAVDATDEGVVVEMHPREYHYNPLGTVHGGVLATLLDTATGCAVHATLPAGWGYTSLDLTTKFLRPVTTASGLLRCVGAVVSRGRRTALAEARLHDAAGRLVAHATSSCLLFPVDGGNESESGSETRNAVGPGARNGQS
jgi:uncharacterized protein (TIGR00369 family)